MHKKTKRKLPSFPDYEVKVKYATEHRCGVRVRGPGLVGNITGTDPLVDKLGLSAVIVDLYFYYYYLLLLLSDALTIIKSSKLLVTCEPTEKGDNAAEMTSKVWRFYFFANACFQFY